MVRLIVLLVCIASNLMATPKRDCSRLPAKEREFASSLSVAKRKIFCGRFSPAQRSMAMRYANELSPDTAIVRVMEETGMSLSVKHRKQAEISQKSSTEPH